MLMRNRAEESGTVNSGDSEPGAGGARAPHERTPASPMGLRTSGRAGSEKHYCGRIGGDARDLGSARTALEIVWIGEAGRQAFRRPLVRQIVSVPAIVDKLRQWKRSRARRQQRQLPALQSGGQPYGEAIAVNAEIDDVMMLRQHAAQR